jgi:hypothetical protein
MSIRTTKRKLTAAEIKNMLIADEAVRLANEDPNLSVEEALDKSKRMIEEG